MFAGCGGGAAGAPPSISGEPSAVEPIQAPAASEPAPTNPEPPARQAEEPEQADVDAGPTVEEGKGANEGEAEIVRAGTVPREAMVAMLDRGIARFLQQVDTRPLTVQGRFAGWRLLEFFPGDERFAGCGVGKGDTILRVNGRSIERPESFKSVWDSLYTARELRVLLLRTGRVYEVRYEIAQGSAPSGAPGRQQGDVVE